MKRLTLDEIGNLAGVSRATVSRVINNYPHITPDVRARVQKVIQETGYQPNLIARSLASDRSGIIGLVIPCDSRAVFTDPYFASLIQGITRATNQRSLTLSLFLFHSIEEETITTRSILTTGLLDGLIITADRREDPLLAHMVGYDLPLLVIGRPDAEVDCPYVNADNVHGAYLATEHLIRLGRQRIAMIASELNTAGQDRYAGYCNALQAYGVPFDEHLVAMGDFSLDSGYEALKRLLPQQPDAVFVCSDTMALGAQRAIREAGLRMPDDIAVVGFDDLPPAVHGDPQLTTVRQPIEEMGMVAVDMLSAIIEGAETPASVILPVELIIRESSGSGQSS